MTVTTTYLPGEEPMVSVLHLDSALGRVLKPVAKALQARVAVFGRVEEFLEVAGDQGPGCVVLNLRAGKSNGSTEQIARLAMHLPVVVLAVEGDVPLVVQAMRAGARNYLTRPCTPADLREALQDALAWNARQRREQAEHHRVKSRLARLTPGECDVLRLLVEGRSNRQVADALGVSVRAIEVRRAKLMQKMKAESLAELVRLALSVLPTVK